MPRTAAPSGSGAVCHTPALSRLTVGSHTVGGMPVSVVSPLDSRATPASAVVSVPAQMVRDHPVGGAPVVNGPVPSHHRTGPRPYRGSVPATCAQSGYPSTVSLPMRRSTTGDPVFAPEAPATYLSNHRSMLSNSWFGRPSRPV